MIIGNAIGTFFQRKKGGGIQPPSNFDQAWTVTGKSNTDADAARIKNLAGNNNVLNLYNFTFAENSGYGSYLYDFRTWENSASVLDITKTNSSIEGSYSDSLWQVYTEKIIRTGTLRLNIETDSTCYFSYLSGEAWIDLKQLSNGMNEIDLSIIPEDTVMIGVTISRGSLKVTQIPDYEGYLVTDGIKDYFRTPASFGNTFISGNWTMVGEWKLLDDANLASGFIITSIVHIYPRTRGLTIYIKSTSQPTQLSQLKSLKAICSDGRAYDENWNEIQVFAGENLSANSALYMGGNIAQTSFNKMAFKNLAFYSRKLTKSQCVEAYNYLQGLS